ncbi:MAG TPA: DUF3857 domain-containing protein [Candidatus Angelobacter sp.]|nr:DUF3857 domain-containing protein [Candidatus Angelobacter sp.]
MKTLLRCLLLVCLLVPSGYLSAQTVNPFDIQLKQIQSGFSSTGELQQLVLLNQMFRLADYVDHPQDVLAFLDSVTTGGEPAIVRREASAISAERRGEGGPGAPQRWFAETESTRRVLSTAAGLMRPGVAEPYQLLSELEHMAGSPNAAEHIEKAARLSPSAERWRLVAGCTDDPFQKFAALQSGLALDPDNAPLNLQLAEYYIGRNQPEKARDLLTHASIARPDNFVLHTRLAELYLKLGLRSQALRDLKKLQQQWPDPLWLARRLAIDYEQLGLRDEAAALAASALSREQNSPEMLQLLARFHRSRHMLRELKSDYRSLSALQPESQDVWRKLARLQAGSGDLDGARSSLLRLLALTPNDASAHRQLAKTDELLHLPAEATQQSADAERATGTSHTNSGDDDQQFLTSTAALAHAAFAAAPASAMTLADIRVQELYSNGLDRLHVQQIFFVGSDAGVDERRVTEIRYSPLSQALRVLHARDWKPNGKVLDAQDLGDRQPEGDSRSLYYDARIRQLRFSGLERGDVVEIEYSLSPILTFGSYGNYFGELVSFASPTATCLKRYVLIAPARETIYSHAEKLPPASVLVQGHRKIRIWEARALPAMAREPRSPGSTELAPYVHISTFSDWRKLGAWYANLIRPQFALDQSLQQKLLELLAGKHNDREKIAAIQDFVLRSTHYIAQEFGVYSYKPYPVAETYARRFGDCKDKASLMIALLRAAGIEARLALVRTRSLGAVFPHPASMAVFDHAIVYIPKYDLWLDGTADYAVRELPLEDQGALALTVGIDGDAQLRHTPMSRATDNYTRHVIQAQLTSQGLIHFSGSTAARGEDAPGLREELSVRDQQLNSWQRDLAQVFPSVKVYSVNVNDEDWATASPQAAEGGEISVEFHGDLSSSRLKRVVSLGSSWTPRSYAEVLAPSGRRTQDLLLFAPWVTEEKIQVSLPARARVTSVPQDKNMSTAFGSLKLHYTKLPGSVIIESKVQFNQARIAARDYSAFRQFCLEVERSFREQVKVELPQ